MNKEHADGQQRQDKKMRAAAFTAGFDAGAAWAISRGVRELASILEKTADRWSGFPPDLVKSFAAAMTEFAPEIEKTIATEMKKARKKAAAAQ